MTNDLNPQQAGEIVDALASGRKIEAIKLCREYTVAGASPPLQR
jgi:hypothetical protein